MINKHENVQININKRNISADKNIAELIYELNNKGLKTIASCEGELNPKSIHEFVYVSIKMDNAYFIYDPRDNVLCINWNKSKDIIPLPKSRIIINDKYQKVINRHFNE